MRIRCYLGPLSSLFEMYHWNAGHLTPEQSTSLMEYLQVNLCSDCGAGCKKNNEVNSEAEHHNREEWGEPT